MDKLTEGINNILGGKRAYFSLPITGRDYEEEVLVRCAKAKETWGDTMNVVTPPELCERDIEYEEAMKRCFREIEKCDLIIMAKDYRTSDGCMREFDYACHLGKAVLFDFIV